MKDRKIGYFAIYVATTIVKLFHENICAKEVYKHSGCCGSAGLVFVSW